MHLDNQPKSCKKLMVSTGDARALILLASAYTTTAHGGDRALVLLASAHTRPGFYRTSRTGSNPAESPHSAAAAYATTRRGKGPTGINLKGPTGTEEVAALLESSPTSPVRRRDRKGRLVADDSFYTTNLVFRAQPRPPRASEAAGRAVTGELVPMRLVVV